MGGRVTARGAVAVAGSAVWVAGILLLDDKTAAIVFAAAFALGLPALLHVVEGERAERRKAVRLAVLLLVMLPLAVLVFDDRDELAALVPAAMAAAILVNQWSRPEQDR